MFNMYSLYCKAALLHAAATAEPVSLRVARTGNLSAGLSSEAAELASCGYAQDEFSTALRQCQNDAEAAFDFLYCSLTGSLESIL